MTKTTTANYLSIAAPGNSFNARISADSDVFARNDIDALGDALDLHDHSSGKGLIVQTLNASQVNGDLFYATAANVVARLAVGSAAQHVAVSGGVPVWASWNLGFATGSAALTAPGAAYADITDLAVTLTTNGGDLLCVMVCSWNEVTTSGDAMTNALSLDAAAEVGNQRYTTAAASSGTVVTCLWRFTGVSAASHTVKGRFKVTANGANWGNTPDNTARVLLVVELR